MQIQTHLKDFRYMDTRLPEDKVHETISHE